MSVTPYASPTPTTPWVPLWPLGGQTLGELGYAELPSPTSVTGSVEASAVTIVTAPTIMLDGATPIVVEFQCPGLTAPAGQALYLWLFDNGVSIGRIGSTGNGGANPGGTGVRAARRLIPSAGSHAYSIRATMSGGTGSVDAGPGGISATMPAFIRVTLASPISNAPAGAVLPVQYGTSLPVGPVDGQEAILVDSLTNPSYQWRFRYNAGSSSAYKWECIGGAPWVTLVAGSVALAAAWTLQTPTVTIPRSGDYLISTAAQINGGSGVAYAGMFINAVLQDPGIARSGGYAGPETQVGRPNMPLTFAAGNTVSLASYGAGSMLQRTIAVQPVRVS